MLRLLVILLVQTSANGSLRSFSRNAEQRVDDLPVLKADVGAVLTREVFNQELALSDSPSMGTAKTIYDLIDMDANGEIDENELSLAYQLMSRTINTLRALKETGKTKEDLFGVIAWLLRPDANLHYRLGFRTIVQFVSELLDQC